MKIDLISFGRWTLSAGLAATLIACGGTSTNTLSSTPATAIDIQGRWSATSMGVTPGYTAVVLTAPGNTASAWVLAQDASRVAKLSVSATDAVSGKLYDLVNPASVAASIAGNATHDLASTTKTLTLSNVLPVALILNRSDSMTTPAVQADVVGTWKFTTAAGQLATTWSVNNTGTVGIVSTPSCTYAGTLTAMATASAYVAYFTEKCPGSTEILNSGIATLSADKTRLTVVTTTSDESRATVLFFSK